MMTATTDARVLDLCCGMGGLSVAARDLGMQVVAGVDLNPSALRTFGRNFPEAEAIEGSVRSGTVLKRCRALLDGRGDDLSVVLSGPPCQGFSAARSQASAAYSGSGRRQSALRQTGGQGCREGIRTVPTKNAKHTRCYDLMLAHRSPAPSCAYWSKWLAWVMVWVL